MLSMASISRCPQFYTYIIIIIIIIEDLLENDVLWYGRSLLSFRSTVLLPSSPSKYNPSNQQDANSNCYYYYYYYYYYYVIVSYCHILY
jgi:hypothetical protein